MLKPHLVAMWCLLVEEGVGSIKLSQSENGVGLRKIFCPCPVLTSVYPNGSCSLAAEVILKY